MSFDLPSIPISYAHSTHPSQRLHIDRNILHPNTNHYQYNQSAQHAYFGGLSPSSKAPNHPIELPHLNRFGDNQGPMSARTEVSPRTIRDTASSCNASPRNALLYPSPSQVSTQASMGFLPNHGLLRSPSFHNLSRPGVFSGSSPSTHSSLPSLNFDHIPSIHDGFTPSPSARKIIHEEDPALPKLERIIERQNQLLSKFLDRVSDQKLQDLRQHNFEITHETKDLETETHQTNHELTKQNKKLFVTEPEGIKPPKNSPPKKSIRETLYNIVIKQAFESNNEGQLTNRSSPEKASKPKKEVHFDLGESSSSSSNTPHTPKVLESENVPLRSRRSAKVKLRITKNDSSDKHNYVPSPDKGGLTVKDLKGEDKPAVKSILKTSSMPRLDLHSPSESPRLKSSRQNNEASANDDYFENQQAREKSEEKPLKGILKPPSISSLGELPPESPKKSLRLNIEPLANNNYFDSQSTKVEEKPRKGILKPSSISSLDNIHSPCESPKHGDRVVIEKSPKKTLKQIMEALTNGDCFEEQPQQQPVLVMKEQRRAKGRALTFSERIVEVNYDDEEEEKPAFLSPTRKERVVKKITTNRRVKSLKDLHKEAGESEQRTVEADKMLGK